MILEEVKTINVLLARVLSISTTCALRRRVLLDRRPHHESPSCAAKHAQASVERDAAAHSIQKALTPKRWRKPFGIPILFPVACGSLGGGRRGHDRIVEIRGTSRKVWRISSRSVRPPSPAGNSPALTRSRRILACARARARRWRRELGGGVRQHPGSNNCVEAH